MKSKYKQMAFDTAFRNPERYKGILTIIKKYENKILNDNNLLVIVSDLYLKGLVTSKKIIINDKSTIKSLSKKVKEVNKTRRADGGYPQGYQSRFWSYMRTMSELGFVYAQYNCELKYSEIANKMINNEIDEQGAFAIQAVKYNRKSPFRNVSNDFNYFKFIVNVLNKIKRLSYEQFIVSSYSKDGNVKDFLATIKNNKFNNNETVLKYVRNTFGTKLKDKTILREYPDVVLRILLITGFVSVKYEGKPFIYLNIDLKDYIKALFDIKITITDAQKREPFQYFIILESYNNKLLKIVEDYQNKKLKAKETDIFSKMIELIKYYNLDEKIILDSINKIQSRKNVIEAFKYIPEPIKLEFLTSLLIVLKYKNEFIVKPNYKADFLGMPISQAPGKKGDIEVFSKKIYWLIEVTLITNKNQQLNNETTTVIRHFNEDNKYYDYESKYLSFVAPFIHDDTKAFYEYSAVNLKRNKNKIYIKAYTIGEFNNVTTRKNNISDMELYTNKLIQKHNEAIVN